MKKRIYFENLDGLRFLCFLSVFFFHSFYTDSSELKTSSVYHFVKVGIFGNGNIGVNFFFVLSGFLITFLLLEEKKLRGQIKLKNFWLRRILRIWPLFYSCVFFGFVIFPKLKLLLGQIPNETATPFFYLTFLNNFDFLIKGIPDSSILGVLWSVAIEEQFYLVWPIIIFIFPIHKLWIPFSIIVLVNLIFRAYYDTFLIHEHHTISCIGDMTIGAIGAWLINISENFKKQIETLSKSKIAAIYFIFITLFFFRQELLFSHYGIRIFERMIFAFIILLIILEQTFSHNSFFKMSNFKTISKLGGITYGLYCLHFVGILITISITKKLALNTHLWQVFLLDTSIALLLTIIISKISYTYFESPFLKLKDKYSIITK
ncbi:MAG: acyltransferase [Bacteroidetes bacterium]|nr:acyltransferase [Bacteroidota bacterium]MBK6839241.1 acyltransferase [Bacteroidota bacterium]MBK9524347.1 acyltransferase [Bacteroidota bacterium]MBP6401302.1 acyltransferase [Bacteroidia bacterium]MBP6649122.1 acyltransferase [Bacteroidia bacterium]